MEVRPERGNYESVDFGEMLSGRSGALIAHVWMLYDYMMNHGMSPVEWLLNRKLKPPP